ncbi:membrane integrity-associated transporter subunit PqiC [Enterobacteriaceae bacterium LUAb1]
MIRWLSVIFVVLLSGCASESKTHYYQLPIVNMAGTVNYSQDGSRSLWIGQVFVPDYLAGNGIVIQTSAVGYAIAQNNQWTSPLDQMLKQTLVSNLTAISPARLVTLSPMGEHDTLNINVTGFQGRYDGYVVVSGSWVLEKRGKFIKESFNIALPQQQDGYESLVMSLGQAWQQVAQTIARRCYQ